MIIKHHPTRPALRLVEHIFSTYFDSLNISQFFQWKVGRGIQIKQDQIGRFPEGRRRWRERKRWKWFIRFYVYIVIYIY